MHIFTNSKNASFPTRQYINNGNISNIYKAMPSQFYPSANSSLFSIGRQSFMNSTTKNDYIKKKKIGIKTASEITDNKKNNAIGKSSIQSNLSQQNLSFRSQDNNIRNKLLQKCRAGGCIAPAKKNANK